MNFPFFIAKRYLVSKKSHNAINIISGISVAGVAIGTMALIIVLSAFNGLSDLVESLYNSFDPDIHISIKQGKTFNASAPELSELKKIKGISFYTEVAEGNALLKFNDKQCVATIKGVEETFGKESGFDSLVISGKFDISANHIVIGKGIGYVLQNGADDIFSPISVYAPKRGITGSSLNPEDGLNEMKVYTAGEFSINDDFDYKYVIMNIAKARELLDYNNEVTSIELGIAKDANAGKIQEEIRKLLGDKYLVKNREQQNELLYKTLRSEKLWTFIILVFILVIATFNVIGSLTMLIIEKKKDITILHNMGADLQLIRKIFLVEGMLITFTGAAAGIFLGTLICWLQRTFSLVKFDEGYVIEAYPISFHTMDFIMVITAVTLIGFFAAWYPVRVFTKKHLTS
ncbi:MAG TPA: FtsX-like permease family protein [Bacteroidia bacterium]|jgi:lipoprotein-releasing system permease protein